ncbi:hypothetical protein ACU61A_32060 [Pseudonocardia sichuanensis]|uniref:Uncharacterized protein n=1 Tax=Pseudonocardia kunmingensis TaxID=630975 RepID=A0A543DXR8_9PSEU|nr:hypothetical protein [Pseudonocardia kunmingensis]TQM14123.1 hypothetical protein FB558_0881 [Pseudonocardia kunmingensis]
MIIDCDGCAVRGSACGECVIGVLLGPPGASGAGNVDDGRPPEVPSGAPIVQLDAPERQALAVLADQGLVPRLRLVATRTRRTPLEAGEEGGARDAG